MAKDLKQQAYLYLRQQLLRGQLRAGTTLSPYAVAREMGISHTPVREAMTRHIKRAREIHLRLFEQQASQNGRSLDDVSLLDDALLADAVASAHDASCTGNGPDEAADGSGA